VRLFFVDQLLISSGVFCEGLLLLEDQADPENYLEDYYFLAKRRTRHRYALELMIPYP
jgi:hypothetical protein